MSEQKCAYDGTKCDRLGIYRVLIEDLAGLAITQAELKMAHNWFRRIRWLEAVFRSLSNTGDGSSIVESR